MAKYGFCYMLAPRWIHWHSQSQLLPVLFGKNLSSPQRQKQRNESGLLLGLTQCALLPVNLNLLHLYHLKEVKRGKLATL